MLSVHIEDGAVSVRDVAPPRRESGEALIRLIAGGVCNTDLELQRGYYGFRGTPGHEFVGEVVEADDARLVGQRVVGEINIVCEACEYCARGMSNHCSARSVLGIVNRPGAFQELFTLPERNLHVVPDSIADSEAVFTEPLAAACHVTSQVKLERGRPVAVMGDGKLGLLIAQALQVSGYRVFLFGRNPAKLAIAENAGVQTSAAPVPNGEFDVIVEATGSADGLSQAVAAVKPAGTIVLKSTVHGKPEIDTAAVVVNEIQLVGSRCGKFEPALAMLEKKEIDVGPMVSRTMGLAEAPAAFEYAAGKGVLKVLLSL